MDKSWAYCLWEGGRATPIAVEEAHSGCAGSVFSWLHIEGDDEACLAWLRKDSDLPESAVEALLATETRPRAAELAGGAIVNLRGVNSAPNAEPEDLVSIRLWAQEGRVISVNFRPLLALTDMRAKMEEGCILDPGDFIAALARVMTERLEPVISDLGDEVDDLEERLPDRSSWGEISASVGEARRTAIELRRYIAPQREALVRLITGNLGWLTEDDRHHLREAADHVARMAEELDSVRDRAAVLRDELSDMVAERTNQRALVLSITAAIYLPLTFVTGLLGMNVRGIPFAEEPWAFAAVLAFNFAFALVLLLWFKWRHWF